MKTMQQLRKLGIMVDGELHLPIGIKTSAFDVPVNYIKETIKTRDAIGLVDVPMTINSFPEARDIVKYNNTPSEQITINSETTKRRNKSGGKILNKTENDINNVNSSGDRN